VYAYLILHYRIANILDQIPKLLRILDIVEKPFNVSLFFQRG